MFFFFIDFSRVHSILGCIQLFILYSFSISAANFSAIFSATEVSSSTEVSSASNEVSSSSMVTIVPMSSDASSSVQLNVLSQSPLSFRMRTYNTRIKGLDIQGDNDDITFSLVWNQWGLWTRRSWKLSQSPTLSQIPWSLIIWLI